LAELVLAAVLVWVATIEMAAAVAAVAVAAVVAAAAVGISPVSPARHGTGTVLPPSEVALAPEVPP